MSYPRGPQHHPTASDELWSEVLQVPCGYCQAPINEKCVHAGLERRAKRVPCASRIKAAERQAS